MRKGTVPPLSVRPTGLLHRIWQVAYETGYGALRVLVLLLFRPLFLIRRVGPVPEIPARGSLIVCANHASYLDPAFIQLVLRRRIVFVMTNDFYRRAWGRWFFRLVGAIPVGSGRLAKQGLERSVALLRSGAMVGIFPEGRLSPDGTLGPPQRGVAVLARMGCAPVLTAGILGNHRAWTRGAYWPRRADVRIAFGPIFPPPPAHPAPGRAQEQAYVNQIMGAIEAARELARNSRRPGLQ